MKRHVSTLSSLKHTGILCRQPPTTAIIHPDNGAQQITQMTISNEPKKNIKEEVRPKKKIEYYRLKNTEDYMSICKRVTATRQSIDLVEKYLATMQNEMKRCRKKKR